MNTHALLERIFGLALLAWPGGASVLHAQLVVNQTQSPQVMVQNNLMGANTFITNVTFNGNPGNIPVPPSMSVIGEIAKFNASNTMLGFDAGVVLCTGAADYMLQGPNNRLMPEVGGIGGGGFWTSPDIDLSHLSAWPSWQSSGGGNIGNKSVLEFDFVPTRDMISFRYVFSSEEYERWVCSQYNDAMGLFISGPGIPTDINGPYTNNAMNMAFIPGSLSVVSVNTVNSGVMDGSSANGPLFDPFKYCFEADPNWQANSAYYRYNGGIWHIPMPPGSAYQLDEPYASDPYYLQHNGFTVVLTASAAVQCGEMYHMKFAIGNVGDNRFGSALWLEQGSFTSSDRFSLTVDAGPTVEYNDPDTIFIENDCDSVYLRFNRLGGFYLDEWLQVQVEGEATNGMDVQPAIPDSVHFNQLDSAVVVPIAVPVDTDGPESLIIKLITCNGTRVLTYAYMIDQKPPLEVELDDQDITCPDEVTLTPIVTGGGDDPGQYEYLWNTGDTTSSITVFVDETTQFRVTVKDCWAEAVTDSAWVTLPDYDPLELIVTPDTIIPCPEGADLLATAQGGAGDYSYQWTLGGQVQGNDSLLIVIPANPSPVYYVATVTDLCGTQASDSVQVTQGPAPALTIVLSPDTAIPCLQQADLLVQAHGGGGNITYQWSHNGQVVGTDSILPNIPSADFEVYTVAVSDQCGQVVEGDIVVSAGPPPPLVLDALGDTALCPGMPQVLALSVTGGGGQYSYQWSPAGTTPADGSSMGVQVEQSTAYTVTVTDECGNVADTTVWAVVQVFDPLHILTPDTTICPGTTATLWAVVQGGAGGTEINWLGQDQDGPYLEWTGSQPHVFTVQAMDLCGNSTTATSTVNMYPADLSITGVQVYEGSWLFQGITEPDTGNTSTWDLGDGSHQYNTLTVQHTYNDGEGHWVVLQITTQDGCLAVDSIWTPPPPATIYFPNSFTPNNDGFNDTFGGTGRSITEYELLIFDRWGKLIFESHDIGKRWDGTINGEPPVNGIYNFRYRVIGEEMPETKGFGHVTLIQ